MLSSFEIKDWYETPDETVQNEVKNKLENSHVIYFPHLSFTLSEEERRFLSADYISQNAKNISYLPETKKLGGIADLNDSDYDSLQALMNRYATLTSKLISILIPSYTDNLTIGRTSLRPIQISNRKSSYRKDDTRLHVDAFPSSPNQGNRIIRIFTNINPNGEDRVWRVGESFTNVAKRFLPKIPKPLPGSSKLLHMLKITKTNRTAYDHYMLQIHNRMKADLTYQNTVEQEIIHFPPGVTWMTFTDSVSHAAMSGQHLLEQTFYLPVNAMQSPFCSPLHVLEGLLLKQLA